MKSIAEKDLARHKGIVQKIFDFEWCEKCSGEKPQNDEDED